PLAKTHRRSRHPCHYGQAIRRSRRVFGGRTWLKRLEISRSGLADLQGIRSSLRVNRAIRKAAPRVHRTWRQFLKRSAANELLLPKTGAIEPSRKNTLPFCS